MNSKSVLRPQSVVNLNGDGSAQVDDAYGLQITYGGRLIAAMELDAAIKMAKMVLDFAAWAGIEVADAATDVAGLGEDAWVDYQAGLFDDYAAMADSVRERV